ncbi:glycosyltransferase [Hymenobacter sp. HMF4947]|uniref:Glycosyltransferase n=1 Tax=Hymenobacter ginkgonis TaxID=2682976 RepID=A0A7K1TFQ0_9BACT|nr:glycosyltransferase family 2 protein [Hymenobacter ginkgonis]MVN77244.1 glycosyltransferase [Hymenobacter ginkgonis]
MDNFGNPQVIAILLATYNGGKYLKQQLESLSNQTYSDWKLYVRDDHSSDDTAQILLDYQKQNQDKVFVLKDNLGNLGSSQNFNALLQIADKEAYVMFCDQDDFWLPNKIQLTLDEMHKLENKYGIDYPLLVHTNFKYSDINLKEIVSKKEFQATKIAELNLQHVIAQNPIYGCTVMANRPLVKLVKSIPLVAENHDYWIALVASALGKIYYLNTKTLLYRQHGNNVSGNYNDNSLIQRFKRIIIQKKNLQDALNKVSMAKEFRNKYQDLLSESQISLVDNFVRLFETKSISLFFKNLRSGVRRQTASQTFMFYTSIFLLKE